MRAGEGPARETAPPPVLEEKDLPQLVVTKSELLLWRLEGLEKAHKAAVEAHQASAGRMSETVRDAMKELREEWREERRDFLLEAREVAHSGTLGDFLRMGVAGLLWSIALICAIALGAWLYASVGSGAGRGEPGNASSTTFLGERGGLDGWPVERRGTAWYEIYVPEEDHAVLGLPYGPDGPLPFDGRIVPRRPQLPGWGGPPPALGPGTGETGP